MDETNERHKAKWTDEDDAVIIRNAHLSSAELATRLKRTKYAVAQRRVRLDVPREDKVKTDCNICGKERYWGVSNCLCEEHYLEYMRGQSKKHYAKKHGAQP